MLKLILFANNVENTGNVFLNDIFRKFRGEKYIWYKKLYDTMVLRVDFYFYDFWH